MKKLIFLFSVLAATSMSACKDELFYEREHYKYVLYLLSKDSYNVFPAEYHFPDEGFESVGYLTIGCGGSLTNPEEVVVELDKDDVLFDRYNYGNFDVDESKYARLIPDDKYVLENTTLMFPARNPYQFITVPIKVDLRDLSPDSTYFIPLRIKNVSRYEINPEKSNVLFKVSLKNEYSEQLTPTYYQMRGNTLDINTGDVTGIISSTKLTKPLSRNSIRMFAGNVAETSQSTLQDIRRHAIVVTVDDHNNITIAPYGTIEVEQLAREDYWNTYEEVQTENSRPRRNFYLHYRYRTLNSDGTWSNWIRVKESMYRIDND